MRDAQDRIGSKYADFTVGLLHATVGIAGESGELSTAIEKWLFYGQTLNRDNLKEELGDLLWYIAEACNAADFCLEDVMDGNIAKLKKRYPDKYSDEEALEENRDRKAEMEALNGTIEDARRRPEKYTVSPIGRKVLEEATQPTRSSEAAIAAVSSYVGEKMAAQTYANIQAAKSEQPPADAIEVVTEPIDWNWVYTASRLTKAEELLPTPDSKGYYFCSIYSDAREVNSFTQFVTRYELRKFQTPWGEWSKQLGGIHARK